MVTGKPRSGKTSTWNLAVLLGCLIAFTGNTAYFGVRLPHSDLFGSPRRRGYTVGYAHALTILFDLEGGSTSVRGLVYARVATVPVARLL